MTQALFVVGAVYAAGREHERELATGDGCGTGAG